jgi:uncharacterized protein (TIGR02391 family)
VADLDNTTKLKLESILGMGGGYVLDFSDAAFADFVKTSVGFDPYEKYPSDVSKAKRLRQIWQEESDAIVAKLNGDLLERWLVRKLLAGETPTAAENTLYNELVDCLTQVQTGTLAQATAVTTPVSYTTEATVSGSRIEIEIHEDIYSHIAQYLATGDYFHAVEESYKVVREKLRELTASERATDVFNENAQSNKHYAALFGKAQPTNLAESDFFRGIGYLHLGVQFLRNEKAHTLATPVEPNLALHYISLASLAYDLVTRYVSEETVLEIEEFVAAKKRSYRSASAFYRDFEDGKWLRGLQLPAGLASGSVRKVLKRKWLDEADFTVSWNHSNLVLMQLELVVDGLTEAEIDGLLDLPTRDSYDNDQIAGMEQFLAFVEKKYPEKLSQKAKGWIAAHPA